MDTYLKHYGVKGMKWGVRKDRYVNPKKRAKIDHSKDIHPSIPKGTVVYRVTHEKKDNLTSDIYVTWTDRDRNFYRKNWGDALGDNIAMNKIINDGKNFKTYRYNPADYTAYEQQYKLTEDLKIASYKDTVAALKKVRDSMDDHERFAVYKEYGERKTKKILYEDLDYGDRVSAINKNTKLKSSIVEYAASIGKSACDSWAIEDEKSDNWSNNITRSYWAWEMGASQTLRNKVTSELRKQGYNSCVDVAGVGTKTNPQGVDPIIVFNSSSLEKQNVIKYTEADRESLPDYTPYRDKTLTTTNWKKLEKKIGDL